MIETGRGTMESALRRERKCLCRVIFGIAKEPSILVVRPGKDFTRNRLLHLETVMSTLVSMGGQSLGKELYLQKNGDLEKCPSVSACVRQRGKSVRKRAGSYSAATTKNAGLRKHMLGTASGSGRF